MIPFASFIIETDDSLTIQDVDGSVFVMMSTWADRLGH
jgi:hypothetical protein